MTNEAKLREKIDESGFRMDFVAKKVGITYQGLLNKLRNKREFKASEIQKLCDLLKINAKERQEIFFASV